LPFTLICPLRKFFAGEPMKPATNRLSGLMRNRVDLPQPDGPTSTTNSPSPIVMSTPWIHLRGTERLLDVADSDRRHVSSQFRTGPRMLVLSAVPVIICGPAEVNPGLR